MKARFSFPPLRWSRVQRPQIAGRSLSLKSQEGCLLGSAFSDKHEASVDEESRPLAIREQGERSWGGGVTGNLGENWTHPDGCPHMAQRRRPSLASGFHQSQRWDLAAPAAGRAGPLGRSEAQSPGLPGQNVSPPPQDPPYQAGALAPRPPLDFLTLPGPLCPARLPLLGTLLTRAGLPGSACLCHVGHPGLLSHNMGVYTEAGVLDGGPLALRFDSGPPSPKGVIA